MSPTEMTPQDHVPDRCTNRNRFPDRQHCGYASNTESDVCESYEKTCATTFYSKYYDLADVILLLLLYVQLNLKKKNRQYPRPGHPATADH